jgi:hypothetical protein
MNVNFCYAEIRGRRRPHEERAKAVLVLRPKLGPETTRSKEFGGKSECRAMLEHVAVHKGERESPTPSDKQNSVDIPIRERDGVSSQIALRTSEMSAHQVCRQARSTRPPHPL